MCYGSDTVGSLGEEEVGDYWRLPPYCISFLEMVLLMAEILHQFIGSFSHYKYGFIHPRWCRISAINSSIFPLPSRKITYPILRKGKSSSKGALGGDMLVPRRVLLTYVLPEYTGVGHDVFGIKFLERLVLIFQKIL